MSVAPFDSELVLCKRVEQALWGEQPGTLSANKFDHLFLQAFFFVDSEGYLAHLLHCF